MVLGSLRWEEVSVQGAYSRAESPSVEEAIEDVGDQGARVVDGDVSNSSSKKPLEVRASGVLMRHSSPQIDRVY